MISVSIPSFRKVREEGFFVYEIHVTKPTGRQLIVERRFQEFYEFHKQIGKTVTNPPHFPSRKLPKPLNTNPRFLESRRAALEKYLRDLLRLINVTEVHDHLTGFLDTPLPPGSQNLNLSRTSSIDDLDGYGYQGPTLSHQPLVCYMDDPFKDCKDSTNPLPSIVLQGTLEALYGTFKCDQQDS
ncbi:sorting nexin-24-like [Montipora capricornis]|uniref:sorting nexin-24-like n=1 Tax=Montipora foliosa TaxID=591990 RepID=UPI0035F1A4F4